MKVSYKLQLEQHQRRLGLTHKELNKLDRKHNTINLLRHLQSLEPKVSVSAPTGFYGDFLVINGTQNGSQPRHMHAYLAYDDEALTESVQINGGHGHLFNIAQEDRLPLVNSTLQLKVTMQNNTQAVDIGAYEGFTITNFTDNPLDQENTMSMIVNENNINDGSCELTLLVTYVPPPSGWSGTITFNRTSGGGTQFIYLRTNTGVIANGNTYTGANAFSVSLANAQSYVEISLDYQGYWEIGSQSFDPYFDNPYVYYEAPRHWYRYTIAPNIQSNLAYNFTTFYND